MQLWSQVHKSLQRIRERKLANFIPWGPASIQVSTRDIFWFVAFWAAWQFLFQQKHHIICPPSGGSIAHVPLRLLVPQSVRPYARQSHLHQQVLVLFCLQLRYSDIMVDVSLKWKTVDILNIVDCHASFAACLRESSETTTNWGRGRPSLISSENTQCSRYITCFWMM